MRKASTCPRATQDVESARGTHWVGRTAPLAMPCRDNSAIPRQTGSLLSQLLSSAFAGPSLPALGIWARPLARDGRATQQSGAPPFHARPNLLEHAFAPGRIVTTPGGSQASS